MSKFFHYIMVPSVFTFPVVSRYIIGFCCQSQICARQLNHCNILVFTCALFCYWGHMQQRLVLAFLFSLEICFLFVFNLIFILYWGIVDLQCCVSFRCTAKWFNYTYTYIRSFSVWKFVISLFLQTLLCEILNLLQVILWWVFPPKLETWENEPFV